MFNVLEGDGVIENIYHFLWTKDSIFNTDPYVVIPQTILYKYQKPCYWYFTSVVDHKLKKKSSVKVTNEQIREVFTKRISKSGIVAYYIYKKAQLTSKYDTDKPTFEKTMKNLFNKETEANTNSKGGYVIEYFDLKKFDEFLNNKFNYDDGILQKFEDPKGDYNSTYRLTWSPKLCLFEKCSNLKKITDRKYDIYERAVTYDGEEFQIKTEPLKGTNLPDRIEKIGMSIANHISNITLEKIKIVRMILNFKITKSDKIVFLWCSSLRIENGLDKKHSDDVIKECEVSKISVRVPDNINLFKYNINGKPIKPHKDSVCLNCDMQTESYRLYEISFKTLIESHENRKRDKQLIPIYDKINMTSSGVEIIPYMENKNGDVLEKLRKKNYKNFIIPKVISEIYPKMKYEDYFNLKKDSIFCAKTACVCDSCYLDITRYCTMGGTNMENVLRTMKPAPMIGGLPSIKKKKNAEATTQNNQQEKGNVSPDDKNKSNNRSSQKNILAPSTNNNTNMNKSQARNKTNNNFGQRGNSKGKEMSKTGSTFFSNKSSKQPLNSRSKKEINYNNKSIANLSGSKINRVAPGSVREYNNENKKPSERNKKKRNDFSISEYNSKQNKKQAYKQAKQNNISSNFRDIPYFKFDTSGRMQNEEYSEESNDSYEDIGQKLEKKYKFGDIFKDDKSEDLVFPSTTKNNKMSLKKKYEI